MDGDEDGLAFVQAGGGVLIGFDVDASLRHMGKVVLLVTGVEERDLWGG